MLAVVPVIADNGPTALKVVIGSNNVPASVLSVLIVLVVTMVIVLELPLVTLRVSGTSAVGSPANGTGI